MQNEFARYSCQLNLPGFGEAAQELLQQSNVLIVGMGGLGCPVAQYLASAGIGTLGIADYDTISVSNLHRQILYNDAEVGQYKVAVAAYRLQQQNTAIKIIQHQIQFTADNITELIAPYDIIVDCTDNFETKYLLNDACVLNGKPLVFGAMYQYEGQVSVFNIKDADGTSGINYRDIYPEVNAAQIPNCAEGGIIPTLAGIIGSIQANEVIKYLTNTGELLANKMLIFDALSLQSRIIKMGTVSKVSITSLPIYVSVHVISIQDLRIRLTQEHIELIDVRSAEEHLDYSIGGRNIPIDVLENELSSLDSTHPIVCYCATGKRSTEAAKLILKHYPGVDVMSLNNGISKHQHH